MPTPEFDLCTRLEIQYQPSVLGYFFPHAEQMNLLSPVEKDELTLTQIVVVDDPKSIGAFIQDVSRGTFGSGIVRGKRAANVVCYHGEERMNSFTVYEDSSIATEGNHSFLLCVDGFPSLKACTPQIHPFELRMQCVSNMKNLWRRLQLCMGRSAKYTSTVQPAQVVRFTRHQHNGVRQWSELMRARA